MECSRLEFEEDVAEAISCYLLAIKVSGTMLCILFLINFLKLYRSIKRNSYAASMYQELADFLKELRKFGEAAHYFRQAAELFQQDSPLAAISSLQEATECHVKQSIYFLLWELTEIGDFKSACHVLVWIIKLASEVDSIQGLNETETRNPVQIRGPNYSVFSKAIEQSRISLCLLLILQVKEYSYQLLIL